MAAKHKKIKRLLVANRSEIAIRVLRAANELGISTVAIYSSEDRFALHRFKADESYLVGQGKGPIEAYLDIDDILRIAQQAKVDAVHPGYGFLSENPDFAEACIKAGLIFIGPDPETMRKLGNKVAARNLAMAANVPVMPATEALSGDMAEAKKAADDVGYPVMLKASWGGGGRGMRIVESENKLEGEVTAARREAKAAFGNDEVFLEKFVEKARHVEVQILGDAYGNLVHLFERDCSIQRRNQKVIERAPAPYLTPEKREEVCTYGLNIARAAKYRNAGTVEFLMDADSGDFYFIEVNPRIQVEHTVSEEITGIDIVKAQIRIAEGAVIGEEESGVPKQDDIKLYGHAMQCRITTENPEQDFVPDYGRLLAYRGATGFGVRLDGGTAFAGAHITRFYDSLLEKVTCWAPTSEEVIRRMDRALREFRIRGVATNLPFLEALINHPKFKTAEYTTRFIDQSPELFKFPKRRDRATRLLSFIGDVMVNGNEEVKERPRPEAFQLPQIPRNLPDSVKPGSRDLFKKLGPEKFGEWMKDRNRVLMTDTTFRDAHQSLLATRMRSYDMVAVSDAYARKLNEMYSLECWGGATFDVSMRFLKEDPWERLQLMRQRIPNVLFQMLLRASNAVGYTNYPDNVVDYFVKQAAENGIDLFRVFDSLNWVENMRPAMDSVMENGMLCEAAICYSGDLTDPGRTKYDLKYYVKMAKELEKAGAHILGIKDMAGLCKPEAARRLIKALKEETALPIHFHTHDTSGGSIASVIAAVEAGVDAVDAAMDSFSGLTSQPSMGSIVEALRNTERETGLEPETIREFSNYWEGVRENYAAFESSIRAGASEVYLHEMPGGQYTNLREQARSMGIAERWPEVAKMYAAVNHMFGDIIKVTPTSKVVGDMALYMITSGLTPEDVADPEKEIDFPSSVISFFKGELGQPHGGFPKDLQKKVLKGEKPYTGRPGAELEPVDLEKSREDLEKQTGRKISDTDLASYLMYPAVFLDFAKHRAQYGDTSILPTPVYFYGMDTGDEINVDIEKGKTLIIRCLAVSEPDEEGMRGIFFELNGQPRQVRVRDTALAPAKEARPKIEEGNPDHIGAPMPGLVVSVNVSDGDEVDTGDVLLALEAMKMETTIHAERPGTIKKIHAPVGSQVDAKDMLVEFVAEGEEDGNEGSGDADENANGDQDA